MTYEVRYFIGAIDVNTGGPFKSDFDTYDFDFVQYFVSNFVDEVFSFI